MSYKAIPSLITSTQAYTPANATQMALPAPMLALIVANLGGGDFTSVSVTDGINYEIMNITGVTSGAANIIRGIDGTTAVPLARGALVRFTWTVEGIQATAPAGAVTCAGSGGTNVTGGPNYTISSPIYTFNAGAGIAISGGPYSWTITNTQALVPTVTLTGSGIATVTGGPAYNVDVAAPVFTAGAGITVTGTYPNFTIACTIAPGGTGTVTNLVGGPGITISGGTPTINPTVSLTAVGPGPGTFGGIVLNAYGQITGFTGSLITSVSTSTSGLTISGPTSGALGINIASSSHVQQGLTSYAPDSNAGSNDPGNSAQAVTPAGIAAVVTAITLANTPASFVVAGSQTPLSPPTYSNTIIGFNIPITAVLSGKSALIDLYVESYDPSNPTVVQSMGVGLFDSSTLLAGIGDLVGTLKNLKFLINGPYPATTLTVKTTALVGTQIVGSYYASVTRN